MSDVKSLSLEKSSDKEDLLVGVRKDGKAYSVRKHRKAFFMPDIWLKVIEHLSYRGKLTAEVLVQTGARINEARHIEERDVDYERNTIRLRVTKTKAKKKGEERGSPRTIPMNSQFIKKLKKHFKNNSDKKIGILSTPAFNIALKNAGEKTGVADYYMYSAHNIRKTHGNWLKELGKAGMIDCDAMEICLRLGHDYNTFLSSYGSSSSLNPNDLIIAKKILGDLYARRF